MSDAANETNLLVLEGVHRLLARAAETRSLDASALLPRVSKSLEKYLWRDQPDAPPDVVNNFLDSLRADDLCLVVACERGDEAAWRDLVERYTQTVRQAARSATGNEDACEEIVQSVWADLHGLSKDGVGAKGKLAYYSGCGSLQGWLQAVVRQLAVDRHRQSSRLVQMDEDGDLHPSTSSNGRQTPGQEVTVATSANPEQLLASKQVTHVLQSALARVVSELSGEDQLLIKLYYYDNLLLREAALVLGVHEATASRRLSGAHRKIRERIETILRMEHRWTNEEIKRSMAEAITHFDVDLGRLLNIQTASGEEQNI